jgi:mRNA turnover protein 4
MPRSKRNRVVSLTKTAPKGRSLKTKYISLVHDALDEYDSVYVFSYENMRAGLFKDVRMEWRESRFFLGKNTISRIALGRTPEDEYKDNLRHVSEVENGNIRNTESFINMLFRKLKETAVFCSLTVRRKRLSSKSTYHFAS